MLYGTLVTLSSGEKLVVRAQNWAFTSGPTEYAITVYFKSIKFFNWVHVNRLAIFLKSVLMWFYISSGFSQIPRFCPK